MPAKPRDVESHPPVDVGPRMKPMQVAVYTGTRYVMGHEIQVGDRVAYWVDNTGPKLVRVVELRIPRPCDCVDEDLCHEDDGYMRCQTRMTLVRETSGVEHEIALFLDDMYLVAMHEEHGTG